MSSYLKPSKLSKFLFWATQGSKRTVLNDRNYDLLSHGSYPPQVLDSMDKILRVWGGESKHLRVVEPRQCLIEIYNDAKFSSHDWDKLSGLPIRQQDLISDLKFHLVNLLDVSKVPSRTSKPSRWLGRVLGTPPRLQIENGFLKSTFQNYTHNDWKWVLTFNAPTKRFNSHCLNNIEHIAIISHLGGAEIYTSKQYSNQVEILNKAVSLLWKEYKKEKD